MMDCETSNDLLLDLAYDELDDVRAAAVRKHAEGCSECCQALARVERGRALARQLSTEEPPPVSEALRKALQAAAATNAAALAAVPPTSAGGGNVIPHARPERGVPRWLDRLGELAMRRQVAMAAVFLLMIGVGLIFYQTHPRPSETPDDRVPDVVPAVEVSAAPAARPGPVTPAAARRSASAAQATRVQPMETPERGRVATGSPAAVPPAAQRVESDLAAAEEGQAADREVAIRTQAVPQVAATQDDPPAAPAPPPAPAAAPELQANAVAALQQAQQQQQTAALGPAQAAPPASNFEPVQTAAGMGTQAAPSPARNANHTQVPGSALGNAADGDAFAAAEQAGRIAAAQGNTAVAIAQLRIAMSNAPDATSRVRVARLLAEQYRRAGQPEDALRVEASTGLAEVESNNAADLARRSRAVMRAPAASGPARGGTGRLRPSRAINSSAATASDALSY